MNNFTTRAQEVLALACKEAERLGSAQVEPEHLLLGVFCLPRSNAMGILRNLSIKSKGMRKEIEKAACNQTPGSASAGVRLFSEAYRNSLDLAQNEARRMGHTYLGTEHILFGVLRQGNGASARIFREYGVDLETLRNTLLVENAKAAARKGPALWELIRSINWNLVARL
jgi:ATP-dependent Clp protease ATP-binding subunit ClpC